MQNISDAFGGILSKMIGGIGYTGSAFLQMGTKWKLQLIDFSNKEGGIQLIQLPDGGVILPQWGNCGNPSLRTYGRI